MDCQTERIIQVSLSKITDCRRRRGATLRRSLLVSNILNNVLTSSESAYGHYRTPRDSDMDYDGLDTETMCLDRPAPLRDESGGSGNGQEFRNSSNNAPEAKILCEKPVVENQPIAKNTTRDKDTKISTTNHCNNAVSIKESAVKVVAVGSKRPRTQYANETCENHAVNRKRSRSEITDEHDTFDSENRDPMDISGLVNVFSSSFTGLSGFSTSTSSNDFPCMNTVQSVNAYQFGPWYQQTVEAF